MVQKARIGVSAYRRVGVELAGIRSVICNLSFIIREARASGDAGGGWGCLQAFYADFDFHGLMACSFKSAAYGGSIAGVSSERNSDMLFAAPTVIRWI
jgi:hypothetical protein